jgi:diguanylate cyclase (GGDEF)-like protein/PAS domain S-box-containing protein
MRRNEDRTPRSRLIGDHRDERAVVIQTRSRMLGVGQTRAGSRTTTERRRRAARPSAPARRRLPSRNVALAPTPPAVQGPVDALLEHASEITAVVAADGTYRFVSPASRRVLGYTPTELVGNRLFDLAHPDDAGRARDFFANLASRPGGTGSFAARVRHRDGSLRWLEVVATNRLDDPAIGGIVAHARDATERKEAEAAARESENRFHNAFGFAGIGMALISTDGRILLANRAMGEMLGYGPDELAGVSIRDITHPADLEPNLARIRQLVSGQVGSFQLEKRYLRKDGSVAWGLLNMSLVHDRAGKPLYLISQVQDITERKRAEAALARHAYHDPLTDLPNRLLFNERLEVALAAAEGGRQSVAVLLLDLDGFKLVNDSLGHERGDEVLVEAARRIAACLEQSAPAALLTRLGGDEFAVLLDGAGAEEAAVVATRIRGDMRQPFTLGEREVFVGASIGIAVAGGGVGPSDLLRQADMAMYRAKAQPRIGYQIFDIAMDGEVSRRLALETALRRAVERGAFCLHYQPIVELASGQVAGFEALLRWQDEEHGYVPPAEFIPLAEELGLIVPLGRWVLEAACRQGRIWQDRFGRAAPGLSVNLSVRQIEYPALVPDLARILHETGLAPGKLTIELTESVFAGDIGAHPQTVRDLAALGVRVAIDDFGAGYSSLGYLRRLPVQTLKLDRSFVAELGNSPRAIAIAKAVSALGHALGMAVTAEGVETAHEAAILRALGADFGQGYLFGRPAPIEETDATLHRPLATLAAAS